MELSFSLPFCLLLLQSETRNKPETLKHTAPNFIGSMHNVMSQPPHILPYTIFQEYMGQQCMLSLTQTIFVVRSQESAREVMKTKVLNPGLLSWAPNQECYGATNRAVSSSRWLPEASFTRFCINSIALESKESWENRRSFISWGKCSSASWWVKT